MDNRLAFNKKTKIRHGTNPIITDKGILDINSLCYLDKDGNFIASLKEARWRDENWKKRVEVDNA